MGFVLAIGTLVSLTFGGLWLGSTEVGVANSMTAFTQTTILGMWTVMIPNIGFYLTGVAALMSMDFAFFGGGMGALQWILMLTFGLGLTWGIYSALIYVIQGLFPHR